MNDPELLADARKNRLDIGLMTGEEIANTVTRMEAIPAATLDKLKGISLTQSLRPLASYRGTNGKEL
jgi:hypothetical protein